MNRVLFYESELRDDGSVAVSDFRFEHIRKILKLERGDALRAGVVNGARYDAEVVEIDANGCRFVLTRELPMLPEPKIDLLLALPRPKCLTRILPQLAAIGLRRIFLTSAKKVEKDYWGSRTLDRDETMRLVLEGLSQAGDTRVPQIHIERRLRHTVETFVAGEYRDGHKILAHHEYGNHCAHAAGFADDAPVILAIGPEGGWMDYEIDMFHEFGFTGFSLCDRVLRSDTACIAMISAVNTIRANSRTDVLA